MVLCAAPTPPGRGGSSDSGRAFRSGSGDSRASTLTFGTFRTDCEHLTSTLDCFLKIIASRVVSFFFGGVFHAASGATHGKLNFLRTRQNSNSSCSDFLLQFLSSGFGTGCGSCSSDPPFFFGVFSSASDWSSPSGTSPAVEEDGEFNFFALTFLLIDPTSFFVHSCVLVLTSFPLLHDSTCSGERCFNFFCFLLVSLFRGVFRSASAAVCDLCLLILFPLGLPEFCAASPRSPPSRREGAIKERKKLEKAFARFPRKIENFHGPGIFTIGHNGIRHEGN